MSPKPTATPRGCCCSWSGGSCSGDEDDEGFGVEEERDSSGSRIYTEKSRFESWSSSGLKEQLILYIREREMYVPRTTDSIQTRSEWTNSVFDSILIPTVSSNGIIWLIDRSRVMRSRRTLERNVCCW